MKNLANCKPSEFLVQTNKIRKSVEKWLKLTDITNIRKNVPPIKEGQTKEERRAELAKASKENLNKIFDAILEEHPQETLELLGLLCFVEPENVDNYPVSFYIQNFNEIINDEAVIGFFTSLMSLEQKGILTE